MADNLIFKVGSDQNFKKITKIPEVGSMYLSIVDESICHLDYSDGSYFLNITPRLLSVAHGGTGLTEIKQNQLLYGGEDNTLQTLSIGESGTLLAVNDDKMLEYLSLDIAIDNKEDAEGYIKTVDLKLGSNTIGSFDFATPSQVVISRWED